MEIYEFAEVKICYVDDDDDDDDSNHTLLHSAGQFDRDNERLKLRKTKYECRKWQT